MVWILKTVENGVDLKLRDLYRTNYKGLVATMPLSDEHQHIESIPIYKLKHKYKNLADFKTQFFDDNIGGLSVVIQNSNK